MDSIKEWWTVLYGLTSFIIAGLVWLIRLQGQVGSNSKELARLERQLHDDRAEARANRAEQNEILREMQRDIKLLLGQQNRVQHWNDRTQPPR